MRRSTGEEPPTSPRKNRRRQVSFIVPLFASLNVGISGQENVGIQTTRVPLPSILNRGEVHVPVNARRL